MEKLIYDSSNGLWYELQGDYYIPRLSIPETQPIGKWGRMHLRYLQKHRSGFYTSLLLTGKLNGYLRDTDLLMQEIYEQLVRQMAEIEGINEFLKEHNQMEWVKQMNQIIAAATEIISAEYIFT